MDNVEAEAKDCSEQSVPQIVNWPIVLDPGSGFALHMDGRPDIPGQKSYVSISLFFLPSAAFL